MKRKFLKNRSGDELLKGLAENNREVLHIIYDQYFPLIRNMVLQNNGNETSAKDLFQEALMILYDKAKTDNFVLTAQFHTYLYAVCKRLWLKQLQQRKKDPIFPNKEENEASPDIEDALTNHENRELQFKKLSQALRELGSPCNEVLTDFYSHGMSMQQIATKHHYTNTDNAKTQKYKCLQRLKKIFFQQTVDQNKYGDER